MGHSGVLEKFVDLDMFGHVIGVHYRGRDAYKTCLGATVSLVTYALMIINIVSLSIAFNDGSRQEEKAQFTQVDLWQQDTINLVELDFQIGIVSFLPPDVGKIVGYNDINGQQSMQLNITSCSDE